MTRGIENVDRSSTCTQECKMYYACKTFKRPPETRLANLDWQPHAKRKACVIFTHITNDTIEVMNCA